MGSARAFIDESYRQDLSGAGAYLFSAVTIEADVEEEVRERLTRALPGRVRRFHWRRDSPDVRRRCLEVIERVELLGVTLLQLYVEPAVSERVRQHMLWSLAFAMLDRGVSDLVFEARERSQNRRDEQTLGNIVCTPAAKGLRYTFARPLDEPLLWLPDYLAGAHGADLLDGDGQWIGLLPATMVEVIRVPPHRP